MGINVFHSKKNNAEEIATDLKAQIDTSDSDLIVYFASSKFNPKVLAQSMRRSFSNAKMIGCTTAGEIVSGKMLADSVVAMRIGNSVVDDVCVHVLENIKTQDNVAEAFSAFSNHFGISMSGTDNIDKYVGIVLIDGMSRAEERLMERIGDLTDFTFIGGSAGDDLKFKETYVFADESAQTDAAVLALLRVRNGFDIIKTQSFQQQGSRLTATSVNETDRRVMEFNHRPAVEAYAEALGVSVEEAANRFMRNPFGLMVDSEPYIRSPQKVDGRDMVFYCNVKQGMELNIMTSTDIVSDTRKAVTEKRRELGAISGILDFHCILRTLELRDKNQVDAYGAIFREIPTIGFSTYGEEYIGHINQTSTMLIFR